jgi:hypothetical protein
MKGGQLHGAGDPAVASQRLGPALAVFVAVAFGFSWLTWLPLGWAVALVAGSFWLGWIARLGRWSIVPVVLWHGGFNFFTSSDLGPSTFPATISTLVMVQAGIVIVVLLGRSGARRMVQAEHDFRP